MNMLDGTRLSYRTLNILIVASLIAAALGWTLYLWK